MAKYISGVSREIIGNISPNRTLAPKAGAAAGQSDGDIGYFGETTSMTTGALYHYKSDGTWELADANAVATSDGMLAIALGAASNIDGILLRGFVTLDHDPGSIGDPLYISGTAGDVTPTAPTGNTDVVRIIGYQVISSSDETVWFNPNSSYNIGGGALGEEWETDGNGDVMPIAG